ncbi:MAG: hypothetical protein KC464_25240, partial [Myxococcales bacterium]|nr:hypothetical protein [Myxococcales bacterium]
VTDGPALVEVARGRGALAAPTDPDRAVRVPDAGDLLVFDRAQGGKPASLIAVVLGVDERGVIEMMYLAGGVIRRGFVSPAHPGRKRDDAGRILNTSMRHGNDQPPRGTHYLSGELLAGVVGVAALAR